MEFQLNFFFVLIQLSSLYGLPTETDTSVSLNTTYYEKEGNELYAVNYEEEGRSRKSRKILRKIQSGVAFLIGVKVGTLLAQKGFDAGHGSLAATNSFQVFGKKVNSALSLSYGGAGQELPIVDDAPINLNATKSSGKDLEDILHLTIVRNPTSETIEKLKQIATVSVSETANDGEEFVVVSPKQAVAADNKDALQDSIFLQKHNEMVKSFNVDIKRMSKMPETPPASTTRGTPRRNSKF